MEQSGTGQGAGDDRRPLIEGRSLATLTQMTALVALERIPVPVLALDEDCVIVVANPAFGEMLGRSGDDLSGLFLHELLRNPGSAPLTSAELGRRAGSVLEFVHAESWDVCAKMSESAALPGSASSCLVVFQDVTERAWLERD